MSASTTCGRVGDVLLPPSGGVDPEHLVTERHGLRGDRAAEAASPSTST